MAGRRRSQPTLHMSVPCLIRTKDWSLLSIPGAFAGGKAVRISVSNAKAQLTALVCRAEAGDEVVLTRHGKPAVRLVPVPVQSPPHAKVRRAAIAAMQVAAEEKRT